MSEGYKFIIIKGHKGSYNAELKNIKDNYSKVDMPHLLKGGGGKIMVSSNVDLVEHLETYGIVTTKIDEYQLLQHSNEEKQKPIALDAATEGLLNYADFFSDMVTEKMYAQIKGDNKIKPFQHIEVVITQYFESINENSSSLIQELKRRLISRAQDNEVEMFTRIGSKNGNIYYQLDVNKCVEITSEGWSIIDISSRDIKFRPIKGKADQVEPIHTDKNIKDFIDLFRCSSEEEEFFVSGVLISGMIPGTPTPLINIVCPQGSGKTAVANRFKLVIDPIINDAQGFLLPTTKRDLILTLSQHPCFILDNLSNVKDNLSDIISASITGASVPDRRLYTDDELLIKSLYVFVVFTGITDSVKMADLRARTVDLNVTYNKAQTMGATAFMSEFTTALPELLGCIFNHVVEYLNYEGDVMPPKKYRMVDYYKILKIIEDLYDVDTDDMICNDMTDKSFDNIYNESIGRYLVNKLISEGSDGIGGVLLTDNDDMYMNMSQLLNMMKHDQHSDSLYANSNTLGKGFIRIEEDLRKYGIIRTRKTPKSNLYKFEYLPESADSLINDDDIEEDWY